jgi:hypothetical protein
MKTKIFFILLCATFCAQAMEDANSDSDTTEHPAAERTPFSPRTSLFIEAHNLDIFNKTSCLTIFRERRRLKMQFEAGRPNFLDELGENYFASMAVLEDYLQRLAWHTASVEDFKGLASEAKQREGEFIVRHLVDSLENYKKTIIQLGLSDEQDASKKVFAAVQQRNMYQKLLTKTRKVFNVTDYN